MNLREFVKDTLEEIVRGVQDAQSSEVGENISPAARSAGSNIGVYVARKGNIAFTVNFDVAVTVSESADAEGGGKVTVLAANVGGKLTSNTSEKTVTRLQFGVPVTFPVSDD